jgi:hypothetical protein
MQDFCTSFLIHLFVDVQKRMNNVHIYLSYIVVVVTGTIKSLIDKNVVLQVC